MSYLYKSMRTPGSTITHGIAAILILLGSIPLILRGYSSSVLSFISMLIFSLSMITLYTASTLYHWLDLGEHGNRKLKKFDHMSISFLIAGSYTPICMLILPFPNGAIILAIIWSLALLGILIKAFWVFCPKWFSSVLYIAMGWICVFVFPQLYALMDFSHFMCLLLGGISYTIGGVIYGLKLPLIDGIHPDFGSHEIFHLFVMIGSGFHFVVMWGIAV